MSFPSIRSPLFISIATFFPFAMAWTATQSGCPDASCANSTVEWVKSRVTAIRSDDSFLFNGFIFEPPGEWFFADCGGSPTVREGAGAKSTPHGRATATFRIRNRKLLWAPAKLLSYEEVAQKRRRTITK